MHNNEKSVIKYQEKLSFRDLEPSSCLLIYDQKLKTHPRASLMIKKFPVRYGIQGGETLKDLNRFPGHVEKILKLLQNHNQKDLKVVGFGGGSIGDFSGFFASVFKRGTELVLIPSTWLAALDSSHGGKNGLNAAHLKNQIGTFYTPNRIYIARDILKHQPQALISDAAGELLKIALIEGGKLWQRVNAYHELGEKQFWSILPLAVQAKYHVVQQDPIEKKGFRQVLNFGHTFGHVIEARLSVSHGSSVGQGLVFATEWGYKIGFIGPRQYQTISQNLFYQDFYKSLKSSLARMTAKEVEVTLMMDKKKNKKNDLYFIFPVRPGLCVRHNVKIKNIVQAFKSLKKTILS